MSVNPVSGPVLDAVANRWSPYRFEPRELEDDKLRLCLEAARWAASSFNDQPWSWLIARRQDRDLFEQMISCLIEGNQPWARNAGALILSVSRSSFEHNGKPNRMALHDLGQAAAHLALQATAAGLQVHQMAGVNRSVARQRFQIPEGHEPQTVIAIGYPDTSQPEGEQDIEWSQRESGARRRKNLSEFSFVGKWGNAAEFLGSGP